MKIKINEQELHDIINEAVKRVLDENVTDEGIWGGIKNSVKSTFNGQNGVGRVNGEKGAGFVQSYKNGKVADDLKKISRYLNAYAKYLIKFGLTDAVDIAKKIEAIAMNLEKGGVQMKRGERGRFAGKEDFNYKN